MHKLLLKIYGTHESIAQAHPLHNGLLDKDGAELPVTSGSA